MNKREAFEIYLKLNDECSTHDCKDYEFNEPLYGGGICILNHVDVDDVVRSVRKKLKSIDEKQEAKPSVPLENVGSIIAHGPSPIKEPVPIPKDIGPFNAAKSDNVNRPKHYYKGGVESIDFVKAAVSNLSGFEAVCVANIIKYMWRYKEKNGLEDVMKAAKYLEWLQEEVGKNANKA